MRKGSIVLLLVGLSWGYAGAQTTPVEPSPATRFERVAADYDEVIVHGSSTAGAIRESGGGRVVVRGEELTHPGSEGRTLGIAVEVTEAGAPARSQTSYVDYAEIDSLLEALAYLAKVDSSATKLDRARADFQTRGSLVISAWVTPDGGKASVSSGTVETGIARASLKQSDLDQLRGLITEAKRKLDALK